MRSFAELFNQEVLVELRESRHTNSAILEEDDQQTYCVKIKGLPPECIVIKLDKFRVESGFINENFRKPLLCRCDFVIIDPGHYRLVLIELKSGANGDHEKQLHGGQRITQWLIGQAYDFIRDFDWDINKFKVFMVLVKVDLKRARKRTRVNQIVKGIREIWRGNNEEIHFTQLVQ